MKYGYDQVCFLLYNLLHFRYILISTQNTHETSFLSFSHESLLRSVDALCLFSRYLSRDLLPTGSTSLGDSFYWYCSFSRCARWHYSLCSISRVSVREKMVEDYLCRWRVSIPCETRKALIRAYTSHKSQYRWPHRYFLCRLDRRDLLLEHGVRHE